MFNASRSLKWLREVKGSIVRGKLRVQNISSRIKKENPGGDILLSQEKFLLLWNP